MRFVTQWIQPPAIDGLQRTGQAVRTFVPPFPRQPQHAALTFASELNSGLTRTAAGTVRLSVLGSGVLKATTAQVEISTLTRLMAGVEVAFVDDFEALGIEFDR